MSESSTLTLRVSKGDKSFVVNLSADATVGDLRRKAQSLTGVPASQQKLVGLQKTSAQPADDVTLRTLGVKSNQRIVVFRTVAKQPAERQQESKAQPEPQQQQQQQQQPQQIDNTLEEALLTVRSAVDALEIRVAQVVATNDAQHCRTCVAELERHTLTLDALQSDNDAIRAARKTEVTRIQSLLALLDAVAES
jgi:hypothetical protein